MGRCWEVSRGQKNGNNKEHTGNIYKKTKEQNPVKLYYIIYLATRVYMFLIRQIRGVAVRGSTQRTWTREAFLGG